MFYVLRTMTGRLKEILDSEGRRQTWLAQEIGVHKSTVTFWVTGRMHPTEENQRKIAKALGRTVSDVFPTPDCSTITDQRTKDAA